MAGALRSDRVVLSRSSSLLRPHPTPCRLGATSRLAGYTHRLLPASVRRGRRRPPQFSCLPSAHPALPTPGGSSAPAPSRTSAPSIGLRRDFSGSAPPCPLSGLASRGCKIRLMLRAGQSLPLEGLSTLGFDAGRFPPTPPTCYRASWTATRTGLTPAGRHELVDVGHLNYTTSSRIWLVPTPTGHTKLPLGTSTAFDQRSHAGTEEREPNTARLGGLPRPGRRTASRACHCSTSPLATGRCGPSARTGRHHHAQRP